MKAVFVELPAFARYRAEYLDDDAFVRLQQLLMTNPEAGALISGHKNEMSDLTKTEREKLRQMIKNELEASRNQ